jgi:hypothetical protein
LDLIFFFVGAEKYLTKFKSTKLASY